ncbi:MAG: adenylate/guanylate cyclase domain-containing protein [Desulfobulbaceae bacterium]|nr:adenylate/guanylate cyclase domain-containing protein [Desulfobulbaceae bacterium]
MIFFKKLLTPSPFKTGCLLVLAAGLIYYSFGQEKPAFLKSLDNRITDAMFRIRGETATTGKVVIVDIDEKSLRQIGQWPWPRNTVAKLIKNIGNANAKIVGLDIVFAEADRTSPKKFIDELADILPKNISAAEIEKLKNNEALDHDIALGNALAETSSVLGYVFQTQNDGLKNESETPFPSASIRSQPATASYDDISFIPAYRAIINIAEVAQGQSEGFFNVFPDAAGTVRKVPLLMIMDKVPYPSLALEMIRLPMNAQDITIHLSQQTRAQKGILGVEIGNRFIPTDEHGQMTVNFRGPSHTFDYISAVDILHNKKLDALTGKYVLIGTSAAGLLDLRATPYSSIFPGVEVHANIIDNILANDPFTHDTFTEIGITLTLILVGGLFLSGLLAFGSPVAGGLGGILVVEATIAGNYFLFFKKNELIGLTYPLATIFIIFLVVTLFNYFFEGREKRFISKAFGRYVSPEIVSQLRDHPEKLSLRGDQKNLSVMFSDIRGFTSISEKMNSQELGEFMNIYLTAMSRIVMDNNGTVDKFIGDAVMAIWGAPLDDPKHAAKCVRAAFKMLDRLDELRPGWQKQNLPFIDIGIGINTGIMSVGNFGSEQRFDYTVMGDNVNLASRLEGSNKTYGTNIIISEFTRQALGANFYCRFLDMVRVKGKNLPVTIYEPICEGEPEPHIRQEVEQFEEAMGHYRQRSFTRAEEILKKLSEKKPTKLYSLYLERISYFKNEPPAEDWDGSFTFTTK